MKNVFIPSGGLACSDIREDDLGLAAGEKIISSSEIDGFCRFLVGNGSRVEEWGESDRVPNKKTLVPFHGAPGSELTKLLKRIGVQGNESCRCVERSSIMDARGCDWCEANIDEIVGWLSESAAERGLPFIDAAGRMLVRRAIKNARRAGLGPAA
jgi:hypothetical protein